MPNVLPLEAATSQVDEIGDFTAWRPSDRQTVIATNLSGRGEESLRRHPCLLLAEDDDELRRAEAEEAVRDDGPARVWFSCGA